MSALDSRQAAGAPVRVALWGPPGSGKTTFLSALYIAVARSRHQLMIYGADDESTDFLIEGAMGLTRDRSFPPATRGSRQFSWAVRLEAQIRERRLFGRHATRTVTREFGVDLLDVPGESYADYGSVEPSASLVGGGGDDIGVARLSLADDLAACEGFILLFDPVREWRSGDSYDYFARTLLDIARQFPGSARLPHYLAVCVTKFDDPDVYRRAVSGGYVTLMDSGFRFPRLNPPLPNGSHVSFPGRARRVTRTSCSMP